MFDTTDSNLSAQPLASINAVVLDTETTGLSTESDRIVQIGGVRLLADRVDAENPFDVLVNPGVPIPSFSTAIHDIRDRDVAEADGFAEVMPALAGWVGRSVILGYAIGFDLAILQAEHRRHGLAWRAPRTLDIAHLVQLVAPALPSADLDAAVA